MMQTILDGLLTGLVIFILLVGLPAVVIGGFRYRLQQKNKAFFARYTAFLQAHEGVTFFCYTSRKKLSSFIEQHVLPTLPSDVQVIKLQGKRPQTALDIECISYALYQLKQRGFPNVMKVVDGKMVDQSLHNDIYNAINQNRLNSVQD
uniref:hypothetical protein n=1 Tax=Thaumasiovibrio occultus TaxID=1891184 RepID=UPI000B34DE77